MRVWSRSGSRPTSSGARTLTSFVTIGVNTTATHVMIFSVYGVEDAFETVLLPLNGRRKPIRVAAESSWLALQARRHRLPDRFGATLDHLIETAEEAVERAVHSGV